VAAVNTTKDHLPAMFTSAKRKQVNQMSHLNLQKQKKQNKKQTNQK